VAGGYDYNPIKFKITNGEKGELEKVYIRDKKRSREQITS